MLPPSCASRAAALICACTAQRRSWTQLLSMRAALTLLSMIGSAAARGSMTPYLADSWWELGRFCRSDNAAGNGSSNRASKPHSLVVTVSTCATTGQTTGNTSVMLMRLFGLQQTAGVPGAQCNSTEMLASWMTHALQRLHDCVEHSTLTMK